VDITAIVTALRERLERVLSPPRGHYRPLLVGGDAVGWLDGERASRLAAFADVFHVEQRRVGFVAGLIDCAARTQALDHVARALAGEGLLTAWRNERYAVAPAPGAPALFELERAAARYFGIQTFAAHVNGLVRCDDATRMWLARRSAAKAIDPGLLDNLVGGGIAAGSGIQATLVKEAWEEAGIPDAVATQAKPAGVLHICRAQPDGLQRETIFVHDLWLDADFVPVCQDGEVVEHRLLTMVQAASVATNSVGCDVVTADASLVIVDCLIRHGVIAMDLRDYAALSKLRHPTLELTPP